MILCYKGRRWQDITLVMLGLNNNTSQLGMELLYLVRSEHPFATDIHEDESYRVCIYICI